MKIRVLFADDAGRVSEHLHDALRGAGGEGGATSAAGPQRQRGAGATPALLVKPAASTLVKKST